MSSIVQVVLRGNWNGEEGKKHKTIKAQWFGEQLQQFKYSKGFPVSAAAGEAGVMKAALLVAVHFQLCLPGPPAEVREDSWKQPLRTTDKFQSLSFAFARYSNECGKSIC